jgi:hypothetical protein
MLENEKDQRNSGQHRGFREKDHKGNLHHSTPWNKFLGMELGFHRE